MADGGALRFEGVRRTRGGVAALAGADLDLPHGKITCLIGPSGSGKTTLLRLAIRLEDPDEGEILLDGRPVRDYETADLRRRIGYLTQIPTLFEGSVEENIRYGLGLAGVRDEAEISRRIAHYLPLSGLDETFLPRRARALSVGEQARVALLRAVTREPEVLLLDEPTSALDPPTAERIAETVRGLAHARRTTTLYVTHDHDLAERVSDGIRVLKRGRIVR